MSQPAPPEPLTFGQVSVWRDIERTPRDRWHEPNLTQIVRLPVGATATQTRAALAQLRRRHESLRTTYDFTDAQAPRQIVHHPGDLSIPFEEASGHSPEDGATTADEVARALALRPFHLGRDVGWRAVLVGRHLALTCHHLVSDGLGLVTLRRDLLAALTSGLPEGSTGPVELARYEDSPSGRRRAEAALTHWSGQIDGSDPAPADLDAALVEATMVSEVALNAGERLAQRHGVSLGTVMLAAYCAALAASGRPERTMVRLMASNRFDDRRRDVVTSMNQWVWIPLGDVRRTEFPALLIEIAARTLRAYRHGVYDVDRLHELLAKAGFRAGQYESSCSFNFVSAPTVPKVGGGPGDESIAFSTAASSVGPRWYLRVLHTQEFRLILRLPSGPGTVSTAEAVLRDICHVLQAAAADPA